MSTGRDLVILHVRDDRPHAPNYQRVIDELNDAAVAASERTGWNTTLLATAGSDREEILARAREADLVLVMGGEDVDPALYGGEADYPGGGTHETESDQTMVAVIREAVQDRRPLLGLCRGNQLINVALGGTLIQHMEGHHVDGRDPFVSTTVSVVPGEAEVFDQGGRARCAHHQSVDQLGSGLRVVARSTDGVIEAIAHNEAPVVGVQWHPEHSSTADDQLVALLDHCTRLGGGDGAQ